MKKWTVTIGFLEPKSYGEARKAEDIKLTRKGQSLPRPSFSLAEKDWILSQFQKLSPLPEKVDFDIGDLRSPAHYRYCVAYFIVEADTEFAAQLKAGELTTKCNGLLATLELSIQHSSVREGVSFL